MPPPPQPSPKASNSPTIVPHLPDPAPIMAEGAPRERGTSSIPCLDYDSSKDDFETWIEKFEYAVNVATNAPTLARRHQLYLQWLPLKLDNEARAILKQVPTGLTYEQTIARLKELLIDEVEIYKWKMLEKTIKWDGKESFQALATKVKNAVDRYEKELSPQGKIWAYFFRFRYALPASPYQDYIDTSLAKDDKTIENAKELALRVQMTQQSKEGAKSDTKQVTFTGAAMDDDRIHALELEFAKLKVEREHESKYPDSHPDRDWYYRSPSNGHQEFSGTCERDNSSGSDWYGNPYNSNKFRDDRSCHDHSYNHSSALTAGQSSSQFYPPQGHLPHGHLPHGYQPQGYPPQNVEPMHNPLQHQSGWDHRDCLRQTNGSQNNIYHSRETAEEHDDFGDLDDASLNAYIESLVAVRDKRQARRKKEGNAETSNRLSQGTARR